MYFPFTPLLLKSYISFTGSQCELHTFLIVKNFQRLIFELIVKICSPSNRYTVHPCTEVCMHIHDNNDINKSEHQTVWYVDYTVKSLGVWQKASEKSDKPADSIQNTEVSLISGCFIRLL